MILLCFSTHITIRAATQNFGKNLPGAISYPTLHYFPLHTKIFKNTPKLQQKNLIKPQYNLVIWDQIIVTKFGACF